MGTKTFASSQKNYDFWLKTAKFGPMYAFLVILGQIMAFSAHLIPCPAKKQCEQGGRVVF